MQTLLCIHVEVKQKHDATLSVLLQQTLMFIQAELLPYEFHHQDNDDITEAGPPSQSFISEAHYFDVIANAVALFLNQGKWIWKHLIVIEECQIKCSFKMNHDSAHTTYILDKPVSSTESGN